MHKQPFEMSLIQQSPTASAETLRQNFDRILSTERFAGLKAVLDNVSTDPETIFRSVQAAKSYEELLSSMGYRLNVTNQIHIQDCYSRLAPAGVIKAVLPYYDIPSQSSLPTLVNVDATVTATYKSAAFFNELLAVFKAQLVGQN
jgi:hypothetical protein